MVFGNGVKNIQAAAYNGARTVYNFIFSSSNLLFQVDFDPTTIRKDIKKKNRSQVDGERG